MRSRSAAVPLLFLILFSSCKPASSGSAVTADTNASQAVKNFCGYLGVLKATRKILVGQFVHNAVYYSTEYSSTFTPLVSGTGKNPAVMGIDYDLANVTSSTLPSLTGINSLAKSFASGGGVIQLLWTTRNPWSGGTTGAGDRTNFGALSDLYTSGNSAYAQFLTQLDHLAAGLLDLQTAGVIVLFRPFHEMNGNWFWWGNRDASQFASLWQYVFRYLTTTKGVHNLIWAYTPSQKYSASMAAEDALYPGASYVDVVGIDVYLDNFTIAGYSTVKALGKPLILAEVGAATPNNLSFDFTAMLASLKSNYSDIVYFMSWNGNWAMIKNIGATSVMSDSKIVTREQLPSF